MYVFGGWWRGFTAKDAEDAKDESVCQRRTAKSHGGGGKTVSRKRETGRYVKKRRRRRGIEGRKARGGRGRGGGGRSS